MFRPDSVASLELADAGHLRAAVYRLLAVVWVVSALVNPLQDEHLMDRRKGGCQMKVFSRWESSTGFFILPTVSVETYDSSHFGDEWSRVFGVTFIWMKLIVEFEFRIGRKAIQKEDENFEVDEGTELTEPENLNDLITDNMIMHVLNGVGYEERSWIPVVRKHLFEASLPEKDV